MVPPLSPLEMSVLTSDGLLLKGILEYPESAPGSRYPLAVLAHQYPATADSYGPLVEDLLDLGVACLAFDMRGHGASVMGPGGPVVIETPHGFAPEDFGAAFTRSIGKLNFDRIDDDILRVAGWGVAQNFIDPSRILLVGSSVGGSGALLIAPRIAGLRGLLTLGAAGAPAFGNNAPDRIREGLEGLGIPVMLASSEEDPFDGGGNARSWSEGLDHVTAALVPGAAHGMAIYYDLRKEILAYIKSTLSL